MAILIGTVGADFIAGTADDDQIEGLDGNDLLYGNAGHDKLDGGAGNDVLDGGDGSDELIGGSGNDSITGADGADTAYGGPGADTVAGGAGRDRLSGGSGADTLHGEASNDSLHGGSGDDNLLGGADNDTLYGGPGQDLLSGGPGADNLYGSDGADILSGGIGDNLYGEAGDDVLNWDSEQIILGPFQGGPHSLISGGDGYDTFRINVDALHYTSPNDENVLGPFVQNINLRHNFDGGSETYIKLGASAPENPPGLFINLESIERIEVSGISRLGYGNGPGFPTDDPNPLPDNFTVIGTVHDDFFSGANGDEVLIGGAGNDTIRGGIDEDHLEGGTGQDTIIGGPDADTVAGGADADLFIYQFNPELPPLDGLKAYGLNGNDIILDFNVDEHDVVRLDASLGLTAGLDITPDEANAISSDASEILITQTAENAILTFGGNGATIQFDTLGVDDIGAIGGDTLQALEAKLIGLSGDSAYDPFQIA